MRPLQITTTTHAAVLALYGMALALAAAHVTGQATHVALDKAIGPAGVGAWIVVMVVGSLAALAGALWAPRCPLPVTALAVEAGGTTALAAAFATYELGLWADYGPGQAVTTQTLAAGLAVGALARTAQIVLELRRIDRARAATPERTTRALADTDDD